MGLLVIIFLIWLACILLRWALRINHFIALLERIAVALESRP